HLQKGSNADWSPLYRPSFRGASRSFRCGGVRGGRSWTRLWFSVAGRRLGGAPLTDSTSPNRRTLLLTITRLVEARPGTAGRLRLSAAGKPPPRQSPAPVVSTAFLGGPSRPAIGRYPTGWECSPRVPRSKRRSIELPPSRPQSRPAPGNPPGKYPALQATPL